MKNGGTHARYDLRLPFFSPLRHLRIDLVTQLGLDLACISGEERKETLRARVDNVDFVQRDGVYELASFLDFTFRTLNETRLRNRVR